MEIWQQYVTDLGNNYPFQSVKLAQVSDIGRNTSPLDILPIDDLDNLINFNNSCFFSGLNHRKIKIFFSDDTIYQFVYPYPFSQDLYNHLKSRISVRSFDLIGERINYSRLRRILDYGKQSL